MRIYYKEDSETMKIGVVFKEECVERTLLWGYIVGCLKC